MSAEQEERRARAVWSAIAEPTDAVARALWSVFGAVDALALAAEAPVERCAEAISAALSAPDASEISVVAAHDRPSTRAHVNPAVLACAALQRWRSRLDEGAWTLLEQSAEWGIRAVIPGDREWPLGVNDLRINAPVCLWARGTRLAESPVQPQTAISLVGSRAATPYGLETAHDLAETVACRGAVVVSGGAFGIDAAAHRGALMSGSTVAVLAGGLDDLYPRGNAELLTRVMNNGVVFSEAPLGARPTRWRFLARNRVIAAMAGATVVVEAAWRSGALSTAAHADALSRPVGAVPGSINSAASGGCHRLVRERGAILITGAEDVLELVGDYSSARGDESSGSTVLFDDADLLTPQERLVYDGIPPHSAITLTALARECALDRRQVERACTRIEVLGLADMRGESVRRRRKTARA